MNSMRVDTNSSSSRIFNTIGVAVSIFFATFLIALTSGTLFFSVSDSSAESANVKIIASIDAVISMTHNAAGNTVSIPIIPSPSGTFGSSDMSVYVSTNNLTGYTLTMGTSTSDIALTNTSDTSSTLPSTTSSYASPTTLGVNTWGHSVWTSGQTSSSTTFSVIPDSSLPRTIANTTAPVANHTTTLTFGANVDTTKSSGSYNNTIVFTARTNYVPAPPDILSISTLQEATPMMCYNTAPGATANLRDTRDGKYYRVRKMEDGKCWMIDNLAFDLASPSAPAFSPAPVLGVDGGTITADGTVAQYIQNTGPNSENPNNGTPIQPYLYNWCAALGDYSPGCSLSLAAAGTQYSTVSNNTVVAGSGTSQQKVSGICPGTFRLPKGGPDATGSDPATTANEFASLGIALGGSGASQMHASTWSVWRNLFRASSDSGAWLGSGLIGYQTGTLTNSSYYWSSTAQGWCGMGQCSGGPANSVSVMGVGLGNQFVNPNNTTVAQGFIAVRCLLEDGY